MASESKAAETALILRAQTGTDDGAIARLVAMHQSKVRTFLQRLCHDTSTSDDLAQDVFLIALQKLPQFRGDCRFHTWLCSIAYRCFLQWQRQQQREQEVHHIYLGEQLAHTDRYDNISPEQVAVEKALLQLHEKEAAALTLHYTLDCSHGEIAHIMQLPPGTVKSHILRGREKLRVLLTDTTIEKAS